MPLVSVFIPTRDRLHLLQRAVRAVLANNGVEIELVISDNSTSTETSVWLETVKDPRVRSLRWTEDLDKAEHWSRAAEACTGEYLFKLDDDDTIAPDFLKKTVGYLREHPEAVAVYTGYEIQRSGYDLAVFYYLAAKFVGEAGRRFQLDDEELADWERRASRFATRRAFLNFLAAWSQEDADLAARTWSMIWEKETFAGNWLAIPFLLLADIFSSLRSLGPGGLDRHQQQ
jgi:glycosyltransferase involved in cell wall biosynthesis